MAHDQTEAASGFDVACFPNRSAAGIPQAIRSATRRIDILQMDLESVRTDLTGAIRQALESQSRLRVRVLTLDPSSAYIVGRGQQLGIRLNQHRDELHRSAREVVSAFSDFPSRFSLRIYNEYPTQITFRIDDSVYVGTIAKNHRSRELCTFRLDVGAAGVEWSFLSQFEAIWAISTEYR